MNTTPSSTRHLTSTTASDRSRSAQDQPQVDATRRVRAAGERAVVLHGGGSAGNAWEIGVVAGLLLSRAIVIYRQEVSPMYAISAVGAPLQSTIARLR